ncbi:MAG: hypothetical protein LBH19_02680, partial [Dysgonamonadaceae bacterium]|nr:hypothetical protein [Dysgonamonadaceae bacterium]
MRRTKTLFLICCISLAGIMGYAQSPVVIYSGASLPTEQGWNEWKLDATVNSVAAPVTQVAGSGVLKLTSSNAANQFSQLGWYKTGLGFDLSKGYTIEIKAKLTVAGKGAFNIQGYDNEGKGFRVGISETQLTNQSNPLDATTVIKDDLTNDNAFHIYRLAVAPSGLVTVYRDSQSVGTFQMGFFQFDNIIENGGFEDGDTGDLTNASYFPDFLTQNGSLYLTDDPKNKRTGNFALVLDNNGNGDHNWSETMERTYTRDLAVKPNTPYEISITRRRTQVEPWCYRDMGAFYNDQDGTLGLLGNNRDGRDDDGRPMWGGFDRMWQVHNESFTTPADKQSIRFEFPTWTRNGNTNTTSLDNFIFRERHSDLTIGVTTEPAHAIIDPVFHEGYVNLIQNGDFEDVTLNNDGTPYTWILASEGGENTNEPVGFNPVWGGDVRIQNQNKPDDFNMGDEPYAHSGTNAVRFSSLDNNARNIDFHIELEANKTYRFVFWHRNPKWPDWCWFFVRIGEQEPIWGHHMGDRANKWIPVDLTFTTSETDKTLHLYSTSESHGGWYNQYFDDFTLYEIPDGTPLDPQIVGKTNLIANGDFEDETLNNDGTPYAWALSNPSNNDDAFPMAYNELWGNWVRLQDKEQRGPNYWGDRDDTGYQWAHSGTHS